MTMVERVARALAISAMSDDDARLIKTAWPAYIPDARAAIEAMREPSEAMVVIGAEALTGGPPWKEEAADCFRAMIDAALSEQSA